MALTRDALTAAKLPSYVITGWGNHDHGGQDRPGAYPNPKELAEFSPADHIRVAEYLTARVRPAHLDGSDETFLTLAQTHLLLALAKQGPAPDVEPTPAEQPRRRWWGRREVA